MFIEPGEQPLRLGVAAEERRKASFPEADRAGWFALAEAREKIIEGQRPLLDRLD